jgi:PAS domain S-box-containing protein
MGNHIFAPDYLYLLHGFVWLLAISASRGLARQSHSPAWTCFALFAGCSAALGWSKMLLTDLGDHLAFGLFRYALHALALFFLLEFSRFILIRGRFRPVGIFLQTLIFACIGGVCLATELDPCFAIASIGCFFGFTFAAISCLHLASRLSGGSKVRMQLAAAGMILAALSSAGYLPADALHATGLNLRETQPQDQWLLAGRVLASIITVGALVAEFSVRRLRVVFSERPGFTSRREVSWASSLILVLAFGGIVTAWMGQSRDVEMREEVIQRMRVSAANLGQSGISTLRADERDLHNPHYHRLKGLMRSLVGMDPSIRFAMLMSTRGTEVRFLVDSELPDSPDYSPPGQLYVEVPDGYVERVRTGKPFVLGPIADRWGTWVSGTYPIAYLGPELGWITIDLDFSATDWQLRVQQSRVPPLLITLLVACMLLSSFRAQWRIREGVVELAASERRSSSLVEGSPDCVLMLDRSGRVESINSKGVAMLQRRRAEVVGNVFHDLFSEPTRSLFQQRIQSTFHGLPTMFEAGYKRPDGLALTFRVSLSPINDGSKQVSHAVCTCTDITDRKRYEQALFTAKETAESAAKAKAEFLAVMSHEIRTPLGGVIGMLALLRRLPQSPQQKHYTTLAHDSAEILLEILDDVLDVSKIEAGRLVLESIQFDVRRELSRIVDCMRVRAVEKGLDVNLEFAPDVPATAKGDPTRLRQVLGNLLGNAVKFTSRGSIKVAIGSRRVGAESIELSVSVTDTGAGISPENLSKLFSKFEQGDASTARRYGGSGLGLSIAKHLIERMGGTISVHSQVGVGTEFRFTAMLESAAEASNGPAVETAPVELRPHGARLKILCAEDEMINRVIIEDLLAAMGHSVEFAENGQEAIERLAAEDFDAVLMDKRMPVLDGIEATRRIRSAASGVLDPQVYIIASTANVSEAQRRECREAGANDFIGKPLREAELHAALDRAIVELRLRGRDLPAADSGAEPQGTDTAPGLSENELLAMLDSADDRPARDKDAEPIRAEIARQYLHDAPNRLSQMRAALDSRNAEALGIAAHSLKNISHYVAAFRLCEIARDIEAAADAGNLADVAPLLERAQAEFALARARLQMLNQEKISNETVAG